MRINMHSGLKPYLLVALYLQAIVVANGLVAIFGPPITPFVAFALIGLDLTSRDRLHEAWYGRGLWWKMAMLIAIGSGLSWLLNRNTGPIALASFIAFAASGLVDALMYQLLHRHAYLVKVNGSNIMSAAVDSILFPTLAFGVFLPWIVLGQFVAKVLGGAVWGWALARGETEGIE